MAFPFSSPIFIKRFAGGLIAGSVVFIAGLATHRGAALARPASPPLLSPIAHVQSLPRFQQAQQLCDQKQYVQAAALLEEMANDTTLRGGERIYCHQQRASCLMQTGKPAPPDDAFRAQMDSGLQSVHVAFQRLGKTVSVEQIQKGYGPLHQVMTMADLVKIVRQNGFKAEGVQVNRPGLAHVETPAIALTDENRFVVVLAVAGEGRQGTVRVQDSYKPGDQELLQDVFFARTNGCLLLIHR